MYELTYNKDLMSEELVKIFESKAEDYGFKVTHDDKWMTLSSERGLYFTKIIDELAHICLYRGVYYVDLLA